jgi:hypothetical protein
VVDRPLELAGPVTVELAPPRACGGPFSASSTRLIDDTDHHDERQPPGSDERLSHAFMRVNSGASSFANTSRSKAPSETLV